MATSIKKLVYRVWGMLDGNIESSVESRFTYREIKEAVVAEIASCIVRKKFESANNPDASKYGNDFESKNYENIPVILDEKTGLRKIDLPAEIVATHDQRSIYIYPDLNFSFSRTTPFYPIRSQELTVIRYKGIPCGMVAYYPKGGSLYFMGEFEEETLNATIKNSIPNDDDEPLSAPKEFMNMVCVEAYKTLAVQIKQDDNAIDGVPNP